MASSLFHIPNGPTHRVWTRPPWLPRVLVDWRVSDCDAPSHVTYSNKRWERCWRNCDVRRQCNINKGDCCTFSIFKRQEAFQKPRTALPVRQKTVKQATLDWLAVVLSGHQKPVLKKKKLLIWNCLSEKSPRAIVLVSFIRILCLVRLELTG